MQCGGPIAWRAVRQERTSRSSCKSEICATDEAIKEILSLRHRCDNMNLPDAASLARIHNDNQETVDWAKGTSTKGMHNINLKDCAVCDIIQEKRVDIYHISGAINPSNIFTKEIRDETHFRTLRDSFMMSADAFRNFFTSLSAWMSASWVSGIPIH